MRRFLPCLLVLLSPCFTSLPAQDAAKAATPAPAAPAQASPAPAYRSNPKFQKALEDVQKAKPGKNQLSAWKKAQKIAGDNCTECLHGIIVANMQLSKWKDAITAAQALSAVATTANDKYFAAVEAGSSLLVLHNTKLGQAGQLSLVDGVNKDDDSDQSTKPAKPADNSDLLLADQNFKAALALAPHSQLVRFQDGRTLALLGRDDDARAMFAAYVHDAKPDDTYLPRAAHFAADPHLATLPSAPPFVVHTAQGETLSLESLTGKVVLLDFWASWCGPCQETLPEIKQIADKYAGQPLVVISVSIDQDSGAWHSAMQKAGMTWPQYLDEDGALANAFGVTAIPRFFAIDTFGIMREGKLGAGNDVERMIAKLVREAKQAQSHQGAFAPASAGQ